MVFGFIVRLARGVFGGVSIGAAAAAFTAGAVAGAIAPSSVWLYSALYGSPGGAFALTAFIFLEVATAFGVVRPRAPQIARGMAVVASSAGRGLTVMALCGARALTSQPLPLRGAKWVLSRATARF